MKKIEVLDKSTIDKIAAGEVVERPSSVVKELVENAMDAGATAIAVEIKEGGCGLIRITDNGSGIPKDEVQTAFLRHATSKIKTVEDLLSVSSLGFRGEALSSIAAVSQVELITKTAGEFSGSRYRIEGGVEVGLEEIGAPEGTTFLVRNLFYNVPARKKFLKSAQTEAGYISDLMERLALSRPDISFKFINNNQTKLQTSGNSNLKDIIYHVYGRDITANLIPVDREINGVRLQGFIGKPLVSRGNRSFENYFVNGRYVKSNIIARGIEEGYKGFVMQHKYPFTVLNLSVDGKMLDVNVHPTKMELRISNQEDVFRFIYMTINAALNGRELIPAVSFGKEEEKKKNVVLPKTPEPFEKNRLQEMGQMGKGQPATASYVKESPGYMTGKAVAHGKMESSSNLKNGKVEKQEGVQKSQDFVGAKPTEASLQQAGAMTQHLQNAGTEKQALNQTITQTQSSQEAESPKQGLHQTITQAQSSQETVPPKIATAGTQPQKEIPSQTQSAQQPTPSKTSIPEQLELFDTKLLEQESRSRHKIIGQLFKTYWLVEFEDKLFIIDQHAAHEKVLYERNLKLWAEKEHCSQLISPPLILTLSNKEEELLHTYKSYFEELGFEIESFGGKEYSICAIPANLYGLAQKELFIELIDSLETITSRNTPDMIREKLATMSCKAAVKGNQKMSYQEMDQLMEELMQLENPYNCPHGRPTIISMSKYEIEKKFKRIV